MRRFPSPAMFVACAALFTALTGGAYAGVQALTSAQIKDHTIRLVDMHPSAVKALKGQRGAPGQDGLDGASGFQGPQGLPGVPGFQGAQGTPGAAGAPGARGGFDPAKVTYVEGAEVTIAPGEIGSAPAFCPAGSKAIGVGFFSSIGSVGGTVIGTLGSGVVVWNDTLISIDVSATAVCAAP